jgi:hypothetical protein
MAMSDVISRLRLVHRGRDPRRLDAWLRGPLLLLETAAQAILDGLANGLNKDPENVLGNVCKAYRMVHAPAPVKHPADGIAWPPAAIAGPRWCR